MKIAVISDCHDNISRIKQVLEIVKNEKIDVIISCGDLGNPSTIDEIINNFEGKFYTCLGNADIGLDNINNKNVKVFPKIGLIKLEGKKIYFVHKKEDIYLNLNEFKNADIIFYGHDHKPWIETIKIKNLKLKNIYIANPGNVAGLIYPSTFAIYNLENNKLKLIKL